MKINRSVALVGVLLVALCTSVFAETKIAVMNYQAVLFNSAAANDATIQLRTALAPQQTRLQDIQQQVEVRQSRLTTDQDILTDEEIESFQVEIQELLNERTQLSALLQQEQQKSRNAFVQQFQPVIRTLVSDYVQTENITLVLDAQMVLWNGGEEDITNVILEKFDALYGAENSEPETTEE